MNILIIAMKSVFYTESKKNLYTKEIYLSISLPAFQALPPPV